MVYCAERAWEQAKETSPSPETPLPKFKFLINARGGGFRPPDKDYRAAVFDGMRCCCLLPHAAAAAAAAACVCMKLEYFFKPWPALPPFLSDCTVLGKYYPWLANCHVIFLDVPRIVRGALWAVGKLMGSTGGAAWDELLRVAETKAWPEGIDDAVLVRPSARMHLGRGGS